MPQLTDEPTHQRQDTGPIQFGDDWPGMFIRGDEALAYALDIEEAAEQIEQGDQASRLDAQRLRAFAQVLRQCEARGGVAPLWCCQVQKVLPGEPGHGCGSARFSANF